MRIAYGSSQGDEELRSQNWRARMRSSVGGSVGGPLPGGVDPVGRQSHKDEGGANCMGDRIIWSEDDFASNMPQFYHPAGR